LNVEYALTMEQIGLFWDNQGKFDIALQFLEQSLEIHRKLIDHPTVTYAMLLSRLACVKDNQHLYEEALQL